MIETPHPEPGGRTSALERQRRARSVGGTTLGGAIEGVADGIVSLVQHRFALARHEASEAVRSFGGLAVMAVAGGAVLGFGLAALHVAAVLVAWTLWGPEVGAGLAAGLAAVEVMAGGVLLLAARRKIDEERGRWQGKKTQTEL